LGLHRIAPSPTLDTPIHACYHDFGNKIPGLPYGWWLQGRVTVYGDGSVGDATRSRFLFNFRGE